MPGTNGNFFFHRSAGLWPRILVMSFPRFTALALFLSCLTLWSSIGRAAADIAKGADVGWLQQMTDPSQSSGPFQFYDTDGLQRDPDQVTNCLKILKERGIDTIRLRVLVPPIVSPNWDNQLAGHCTIQEVVPIAVKANALGLRLVISLHYSWTLADPGNQRIPVNWANEIAGMSTTDAVNTLANEVSAHTTDVVNQLKAAGVTPEWIALGNEITNGMLLHIENSVTSPSTRTSPNYGTGAEPRQVHQRGLQRRQGHRSEHQGGHPHRPRPHGQHQQEFLHQPQEQRRPLGRVGDGHQRQPAQRHPGHRQ